MEDFFKAEVGGKRKFTWDRLFHIKSPSARGRQRVYQADYLTSVDQIIPD